MKYKNEYSSNNYTSTQAKKKARGNPVLRFIREYIYIPITILVAAIIFGKIIVIGVVPSASMEPNYMTGSAFVGLRLVDRDDMERGTPVLFHFGDEVFLKRVIGLPGETVSFSDGDVYINGEFLDESEYLADTVYTDSPTESFTVPDGCYFFLGDNRENSYDARYWENSYISSDAVIGRMLVAVKVPFWNGES